MTVTYKQNYTYEPSEFCEDDYTEEELKALFMDILNSECKKAPKPIIHIPAEVLLQQGLIEQNVHFIATNTAIESCLPVEKFFDKFEYKKIKRVIFTSKRLTRKTEY